MGLQRAGHGWATEQQQIPASWSQIETEEEAIILLPWALWTHSFYFIAKIPYTIILIHLLQILLFINFSKAGSQRLPRVSKSSEPRICFGDIAIISLALYALPGTAKLFTKITLHCHTKHLLIALTTILYFELTVYNYMFAEEQKKTSTIFGHGYG